MAIVHGVAAAVSARAQSPLPAYRGLRPLTPTPSRQQPSTSSSAATSTATSLVVPRLPSRGGSETGRGPNRSSTSTPSANPSTFSAADFTVGVRRPSPSSNSTAAAASSNAATSRGPSASAGVRSRPFGSSSPSSRCCFATLGIPATSSVPEIRRAYRSLARQHHPDANPHATGEEASQRFIQIRTAYEIAVTRGQRSASLPASTNAASAASATNATPTRSRRRPSTPTSPPSTSTPPRRRTSERETVVSNSPSASSPSGGGRRRHAPRDDFDDLFDDILGSSPNPRTRSSRQQQRRM